MYIGLGYDVHRFKKGLPLILGGVQIEHKEGLLGHSDADVLIHALMDALLGAAGLPDIGHHFPDTDLQYRNISSLLLLKEVMEMLERERLLVRNVDITLLAERPIIRPYIDRMKENLSKIIGIPPARIGIKATTNEKMGFIGRGEGIAAMAVSSVEPKEQPRKR